MKLNDMEAGKVYQSNYGGYLLFTGETKDEVVRGYKTRTVKRPLVQHIWRNGPQDEDYDPETEGFYLSRAHPESQGTINSLAFDSFDECWRWQLDQTRIKDANQRSAANYEVRLNNALSGLDGVKLGMTGLSTTDSPQFVVYVHGREAAEQIIKRLLEGMTVV